MSVYVHRSLKVAGQVERELIKHVVFWALLIGRYHKEREVNAEFIQDIS